MIGDQQWVQLRHHWLTSIWQPARHFSLSGSLRSWLTETGSITKRFEQCSSSVIVQPLFAGFIDPQQLTSECQQLPNSDRYWLREIVLYSHDQPWLWARTVIPEQTLTDEDVQLMNLNNTPLGHYLFNSGRLSRDYLQIACCDNLWGRRSRLCLSNKPLLLTEVFLPLSPLY